MATLNIEINAPLSAFSKYADDLGYTPQVRNNDASGFIDNPESKQEFLARRVKEIIAEALAKYSADSIERIKRAEYKSERESLETAIKNVTTIKIT